MIKLFFAPFIVLYGIYDAVEDYFLENQMMFLRAFIVFMAWM